MHQLMRKNIFALALVALLSCNIAMGQSRTPVLPEGAEPSKLYTPAIIANGFVFASGQIPYDAKTKSIPAGIEAQTKQAMENLKTVLEAAGTSLDNLVKVNIFLEDINDYAKMNEVYATFFKGAPPVRTALQVGKIPMGAKIEIEGIAVVGQ